MKMTKKSEWQPLMVYLYGRCDFLCADCVCCRITDCVLHYDRYYYAYFRYGAHEGDRYSAGNGCSKT